MSEKEEEKEVERKNPDSAEINEAVSGIVNLNRVLIKQLSGFKHPPPLVGFIMEALNILVGVKPEWKYTLKLFKRFDFLEMLGNFDKDSIKPMTVETLRPYLADPRFDPVTASKTSRAAGVFCKFVVAFFNYAKSKKVPMIVQMDFRKPT